MPPVIRCVPVGRSVKRQPEDEWRKENAFRLARLHLDEAFRLQFAGGVGQAVFRNTELVKLAGGYAKLAIFQAGVRAMLDLKPVESAPGVD
jgi:hypothetical protein